MSTSLFHFLTIIGKGADETEAACEELLGRRVERRPNSHSSLDWTERDHYDIERFCVALVNASRNLPVVYYSQYLDPWTIADSVFRLVKWPDRRRRQTRGSRFGLAFYPSTFSHDFLAAIQALRQGAAYRTEAEQRWFLDHLNEAIDSAGWLQERFLVVTISESIAASRQDEEIRAGLGASMELPKLRD